MKAVALAVILIGTSVSVAARADNESGSFASRICRLGFSSLAGSKDSPALAAAKARAAQRAAERAASGDAPVTEATAHANTQAVSVDGIEVREFDGSTPDGFVPVTPEEFIRMYGTTDPAKIIKAKEVPKALIKPPSADSKKWYRSVVDLGDGHFSSINYTIIETKPSGKVVIQFENPLNRSRLETKEVRPFDLQRGLKELDAPPKTLNTPDAL